ncbi:hypothetical protein [Paralimibaculum aggregatum]|uniref:hypothetical protein n=1 Tax=Paralimibaculum aggregatum TaxID=3036245 RepID=UPI0025549C95|nr:hypothetical protein [Limibaculum sp. NKW23]
MAARAARQEHARPGRAPLGRPARRLAGALETCLRLWLWALGIGFALALVGIAPTAIGVAALTGPVWLVIAALVFWGRMLDETMQPRSDLEEGPR